MQSWQRKSVGAPNIKQAGELLSALRDFCRQNPHWPTDGTLEKRAPALEAITRRVNAEKQPIQDSLERLFHDPLLTTTWLVETKDGKRYYCADRPRASSGGRLQFRYLLGFDQKERTRVVKTEELTREPAPAPHVALVNQINPLLARITDENWELSFLDILHRLCAQDAGEPRIDPVCYG